MSPQDDDVRRLQEVLGEFYAGRTDRDTCRSGVLDIILKRIGCPRVSMWKFEGSAGRLDLVRFAAKRVGGELDATERRLAQDEYRDYFDALTGRGIYVSSDAMNDPALEALREPYLVAHDVRSLLVAAFMVNGRAYGMVCCEETAAPRDWRAGDVMALRAIVTRLALLMSGAPQSVLWAAPSLPPQGPAGRAPQAAADDRTSAGTG